MLELCEEQSLAIANTFSDVPVQARATFRNVGVPSFAEISHTTHSTLDFVLVARCELPRVQLVRSNPLEPLASHHYALEADLDDEIQRETQVSHKCRYDKAALRDPTTAKQFAEQFVEKLSECSEGDVSCVHTLSKKNEDAFRAAEESTLPIARPTKQRPWISKGTLELIEQRHQARQRGEEESEILLHKSIMRSARVDKRTWLLEMAGSGDWKKLNRLRKGSVYQQGKLYNLSGELVSSEQRADTFAEYLEKVQWAVRPVSLTDDPEPVLFPELAVSSEPISMRELRRAVRLFKKGKATGPDDIPVEFWQTVLHNDLDASDWLLRFCNLVWEGRQVPDSWHMQTVALIFKKGGTGECKNYRPICLLNSAYKVFAMVLLQRLLSAGADSRLWASQYGFR